MSTTGIDIRPLDTLEAIEAGSRLFDDVWVGERATMPSNILRALEHSGNYVVGLYDGDRMIGASAAFFGAPAQRTMHSHITGILPGYQGRGLGRQLKAHQREWALEHGIRRITWTFDPLIRRNAHFNLAILGAHATEYLVNQYGEMPDDVNRGDESDRLMVSWAVAEPPALTPAEDAVHAVVEIPDDIEGLRRTDPTVAAGWRSRVREELRGHLASGLRIGGIDGRGYLLVAG
jgi:predicted GNAT superfamily acetyltransferase